MDKKIDLAKRLSVQSEFQWLLFSPKRFIDYSNPVSRVRKWFDGEFVVLRGVLKKRLFYTANKMVTSKPMTATSVFVVLVDEDLNEFKFRIFGRPGFVWSKPKLGDPIVIGATMKFHKEFGMQPTGVSLVDEKDLGKLIAVYPPVSRTAGDKIKNEVNKASNLQNLLTAAEYIEKRLMGWDKAVVNVTGFSCASKMLGCLHRPDTAEQGEAAIESAKIVNALSLVRQAKRFVSQSKELPRSALKIPEHHVSIIKSRLPYPLTPCQDKAVNTIISRLRSTTPLNAVLSGDVGTGKTLTFGLPAILAASNGAFVVVLVPNMLLVEQISSELREISGTVPILKITAESVSGELGNSGEGIAIGTMACVSYFSRKRNARKADFLIVDEQHKFSVGQREALADDHTNILESSATPTPRSTALIIYGGREVLRLETCPVKKTIRTQFFTRDMKHEFAVKLREVLKSGEQMAIVYPLVEENEESNLISVEEAFEKMKLLIPEEKIAVIHGRMGDQEKGDAIESMKRKEKDLLICSTAVEVGITMPHLKHLAVYAPEVFGVASLHQLRGRLARTGGEGDFYLVAASDDLDPDTIDRIELLTKYDNGFDLAEKDAERRGFGDLLLGSSQNGGSISVFSGQELRPRDLALAERIENGESVSRREIQNHLTERGANLALV